MTPDKGVTSDQGRKTSSTKTGSVRGRRKLAPGISQDAPNLKMQRPRISEEARQTQVKTTVRYLGYTVLELGQIKLEPIFIHCTCGREHKRWPQSSGTGNSDGTPDLCVSHPHWNGVSRFWEMKAPDGKVRKKQQDLLDMGISIIILNVDQAVEDLLKIETMLNGPNQAKLKRWLRMNAQSSKGTWVTEAEETEAEEHG